MRKILNGWKNNYVGLDCTLVSVSNIFSYYGLKYSPDLLLGIGCGLSFIYLNRTKPMSKMNLEGIIWMVSGKTSDIHRHIAVNLGVHYHEETHPSEDAAWTYLKWAIDRGRPVMVKINLYTYADCLEGFNLYRSDQRLDELNSYLTERIRQDPLFKNNYYHTTVVVGYDEEKGVVYLSENFFNNIQEVPRDLFMQAIRGTQNKPFYTTVDFFLPREQFPLDVAIYNSIKMNVFLMKNPPIAEMGIPALYQFLHDLSQWKELIKEERVLRDSIYYMAGMSTQVTGGGMYRKRYSRFLALVNKQFPAFHFEKAILRYKVVSSVWTRLLKMLLQAAKAERPEQILQSAELRALTDILRREEVLALEDLEKGCRSYETKLGA